MTSASLPKYANICKYMNILRGLRNCLFYISLKGHTKVSKILESRNPYSFTHLLQLVILPKPRERAGLVQGHTRSYLSKELYT